MTRGEPSSETIEAWTKFIEKLTSEVAAQLGLPIMEFQDASLRWHLEHRLGRHDDPLVVLIGQEVERLGCVVCVSWVNGEIVILGPSWARSLVYLLSNPPANDLDLAAEVVKLLRNPETFSAFLTASTMEQALGYEVLFDRASKRLRDWLAVYGIGVTRDREGEVLGLMDTLEVDAPTVDLTDQVVAS